MDTIPAFDIFWGIGGNRVRFLIAYLFLSSVSLLLLAHKGLVKFTYDEECTNSAKNILLNLVFIAFVIFVWPIIVLAMVIRDRINKEKDE